MLLKKRIQTVLLAAALAAGAVPAQVAAADLYQPPDAPRGRSGGAELTPAADAIPVGALALPPACDVDAARDAPHAGDAEALSAELFSMAAEDFDLAKLCGLMLAGADPNLLDEGLGMRPLHAAIAAGSPPGVYFLLSIGADPNLRSAEKHTALDWSLKFAGRDPEAQGDIGAILRMFDAHCNVNC